MITTRSHSLFDAGQTLMPGGVSSPVRAWKSVGGVPIHMERGRGALVWDVDGNEYVDLVLSYGPLIAGHAHPAVTEAIHKAAERGTTFGTTTEGEIELARRVVERMPVVEQVRFVNSGTEATMSALRLARAATGRDRFLKFDGCYHGHGDSFLVKAGSGALTLGTPDSPGVPAELAAMTLVADYNQLDSVARLFEEHPRSIACVFVEPVAGNMGCVRPAQGFLAGLRELCDRYGALLIFDEVMTGFRVAPGGYVEISGVAPDLVTLGKVIGGGLPIGAYGGRLALMQEIAPAGNVYQAGTLSGNPLAVAAGAATLDLVADEAAYEHLERMGARLQRGLEQAARQLDVPLVVGRQGSMLCPYLTGRTVNGFQDVMDSDRATWNRFFHAMLKRGIHLPPSPFEAWFLSTAHGQEHIDRVVDAAAESLREVAVGD